MAQKMPNIEVIFKKMAVSAIQRSQRGIVCIVVNDKTVGGQAVNKYSYSADVVEKEYTKENYNAIVSAFIGLPQYVYVVKLGDAKTFTDAVELLKGIDYNWLCYLNPAAGEQDKVAAYIKETNLKNKRKKRKAVVYKAATTDDMHVVNFTNEAIKFKTEATYPVSSFTARLCGLLAGLPFTRSATYNVFQELESVTEPEDLDAAVGKGEFILWNDGGQVRVGTAVNSLTTLGENVTEDMQKITIVEAMDMIQTDISQTFADYYCGKYKNNYDNQVLFISAVNSYFRQLTAERVLDPNYNNVSFVDVLAQREQWISTGAPEAADWTEQKVKNMTFRDNVNLAGDIKILDAMENLTFNIELA